MNKIMNIAVIGAGPIGCYAGYLLAKDGHTVSIYENHAQIGLPIQCTGLLTHDFDQFNLPKDSFLVNTLSRIEIFTASGKKTSIAQKEYLVCRKRFDNFFADLARKAGAQIHLNHAFIRKEGAELIIKDTGDPANHLEKRINPDLVIAADGPLSPTAKAYGFYHPGRENYYGIQATIQGTFDPTTYQAHFGTNICPGLFAWVVPESSTIARVGVATLRNTKHYFDQFMNQHGFIATDIQAGTIPVYHPQQALQKDNCYVLGDASGFVKATTLGGLIPGLKQAEIVARCIQEHKDLTSEIKPLARRLWLHQRLHLAFETFSDRDWDRLVSYINQPRIQRILQKHTRENPFPILFKSLILEPRFMLFVRHFIPWTSQT